MERTPVSLREIKQHRKSGDLTYVLAESVGFPMIAFRREGGPIMTVGVYCAPTVRQAPIQVLHASQLSHPCHAPLRRFTDETTEVRGD